MEHLEGRQSVFAALMARQRRFDVILIRHGTHPESIADIIELSSQLSVPVRFVDSREIDSLAAQIRRAAINRYEHDRRHCDHAPAFGALASEPELVRDRTGGLAGIGIFGSSLDRLRLFRVGSCVEQHRPCPHSRVFECDAHCCSGRRLDSVGRTPGRGATHRCGPGTHRCFHGAVT